MIQSDPNKSPEEILEDVRSAMLMAVNQRIPDMTAHATGALLVRLSRDAEKMAAAANAQTQRLVTLTWALIAFTIALLGLTAVLVALEAVRST